MKFFARRTPVRSERELAAVERLALAPWRAELARLGLGGVEPVFAANNDGASLFMSDRRFVVTPEIGVIVVTTERIAFLHRLGDGIGSVVVEPREIGGIARTAGPVGVAVRNTGGYGAGDPRQGGGGLRAPRHSL